MKDTKEHVVEMTDLTKIDEKKEPQQAVKPLSFGKLLTNKISAFTNKIRGNTYRKIENEEEEEKEKDRKERLKHLHKKHSKLDVGSLNAITRNMHLSYLLAIAVIIVGLMAGFLV